MQTKIKKFNFMLVFICESVKSQKKERKIYFKKENSSKNTLNFQLTKMRELSLY